MPLIDVQRRKVRTGAIRIGNQVPTGGTDRNGRPKMRPAKLDTFRVTSPHRGVIDAVAHLFGGTVQAWRGPAGPEFETITTVRELPVLVPQQHIDPNYEMWGNKIRIRLCDGATERIRKAPCLCEQWDNHEHLFRSTGKGRGEACMLCGLDRAWNGPEHRHQYESGGCVVCGCRRPCKPTTRLNVMIRGVPADGVFKVESHGFNAAAELPGLADMVAVAPVPLPGVLGMRHEDRARLVVGAGGERAESREFWVPELRFPWLTPDMAYAGSSQLETAAREQIAVTGRGQQLAIEAPQPDDPEDPKLTIDDMKQLIRAAVNLQQVQQLWRDAKRHGCLNDEVSRLLTSRANDFKAGNDDVVEAEIIESGEWPTVARPADAEVTP